MVSERSGASIQSPQAELKFLAALNDRQRDAVLTPHDQALQVLAGAGTGKTELIARRFVKLYRDFEARGVPEPESRILVVTFTSDAAAGMRARIRQRLWDETGRDPVETSPDFGIGISTFHQFCMRFLRAHAPLADLPPDFSVLNAMEQQILFNRIHEDVMAGHYPDLASVLKKHDLPLSPDVLSPASLHATGLDDPEALLEAGRAYRLINRIKTAGLSPTDFLHQALKQSRRLTECLKNMPLPVLEERMKPVDTIRLAMAGWQDALSPWAFTGWDPFQNAERKAESKGKKLTGSFYRDELPALCGLYLESRTYAPRSPDLGPLDRALAIEERIITVVAAMYALYQEALLEEGVCDFDDLINHATALLVRFPGLRERYRERFASIIVDEFQDSNGAQLRLLELLVRDHGKNLTVVGDIKQSIYGFRFAQPENLELVFRNTDCKRVYLQTNYRSRPPILTVANRLTMRMTHNPNDCLEPPETEALGVADAPAAEPSVIWVNLDGMTEENGKSVHPPISEKRELEAQYIASEIDRLSRKEGAYDFSDIVVLVRSHAKAESIQAALAARDIPSVRQKDLGFFQQPVIKDAMALMRMMRRTADDFPLVRILQRKLNQRQLRELMRLRHAMADHTAASLLSVCLGLRESVHLPPGFTPEVAGAVSDLAQRLVDIRRRRTRMDPVALFSLLADAVGLIGSETPEWRQKQQRLALRTFEKLLDALSRGRSIRPTPDEALELLEQYAAHPEQPLPVAQEISGENAVRIMTVFASKGLEFPVVFVAGVEKSRNVVFDGALLFDPQYDGKAGFGLILGPVNGEASLKKEVRRKCWEAPRLELEAQRLFYVALTRAKERLYVIRCPQSPPWTDPGEYPAQAMRVVSEADVLNANANPVDLYERQTVQAPLI